MPTARQLLATDGDDFEMEFLFDLLAEVMVADWKDLLGSCERHAGDGERWTCDPRDGWHYNEDSGKVLIE
jgi:hypothetical protein